MTPNAAVMEGRRECSQQSDWASETCCADAGGTRKALKTRSFWKRHVKLCRNCLKCHKWGVFTQLTQDTKQKSSHGSTELSQSIIKGLKWNTAPLLSQVQIIHPDDDHTRLLQQQERWVC